MSATHGATQAEVFRERRRLQRLEAMRGSETSLITLCVPGKTQVSLVTAMLKSEAAKAVNIKSRANRNSVRDAIGALLTALAPYARSGLPDNGLALFAGRDEAGGKVEVEAVVPLEPIVRKRYRCGATFDVGPLLSALAETEATGYVVIDGKSTVFARVGRRPTVLHTVRVELPSKHGRGGQSAVRFARLREEARHNYLRKVAELAVEHFIGADHRPSVSGLVLAGSASLKNELAGSALLDGRLKEIIVALVDVAYGGRLGLTHAIERSADALGSARIAQELAVLGDLLSHIVQADNMYALGARDVMTLLEAGAVQTLIVWDELPTVRAVVRHADGSEEARVHEPDTGADLLGEGEELVSAAPLIDWLAEHFRSTGAEAIHFVSETTADGAQLARGLGGIGATLRYAVDITHYDDNEVDDGYGSEYDSEYEADDLDPLMDAYAL